MQDKGCLDALERRGIVNSVEEFVKRINGI